MCPFDTGTELCRTHTPRFAGFPEIGKGADLTVDPYLSDGITEHQLIRGDLPPGPYTTTTNRRKL